MRFCGDSSRLTGSQIGLAAISASILLTAAITSSADPVGSVPVVPDSFSIGGEPVPKPDTFAPMLESGDADENLEFDQYDLVQVLQAAKYLTGQPATWAEGDWNGAPGGSPGSPPLGDGLFDQLDIIAALSAGIYLDGPYAVGGVPAPLPPQILPGGIIGDGQTSVVYDPDTGELSVDAPSGGALTSLNLVSASGIFTGDRPPNLGGSFDNYAGTNLFKATFGVTFGSLSFGNVAQTELSAALVVGDLRVNGSLAGGGGLGDVDLVYLSHGTPTPTPTPTLTPTPAATPNPTPLPEDINEDGHVDELDLLRLQHRWHQGWRD